jgi:hypothetical protein
VTSGRVAEKVYGVVVTESGDVHQERTGKLREEIREARKNRGIPAKEYIGRCRRKLLEGDLPAVLKKALNLSMGNSQKFRDTSFSFRGFNKEFKQIPLRT